MDITRWSIPKSDWLYSLQPKMEKLYTVSKNKTWSCGSDLGLKQDCGSDHGLLIAKFRLKLKKVGKTIRPFRCDLNQIPYDYTVEVRNRFKGLGLIECLMNYGRKFMTLYRRYWSRPSQEKEMQKDKMIVCEGLTNRWEKRGMAKEKRKDIPIWMQSSKE